MSFYKIIKRNFTTIFSQNAYNINTNFDTEFPVTVIKKSEKLQNLISKGDIVVAFKQNSIYKVALDVEENSDTICVYWNNGSKEEMIEIPLGSIKEVYFKNTLDKDSYFKIIEVVNGKWRLTNENQKN